MDERKPAKTPRTPKTEGAAAPKRRRKAAVQVEGLTLRHGEVLMELNPGQEHLIRALSQEFAAAFIPSEAEGELALDPSKPDLVSFLLFELERLCRGQRSLEVAFAC